MHTKHRKKGLAVLLALCMILSAVPLTASAASHTVNSQSALVTAINNSTGTMEAPEEITVSGTVKVSSSIQLPAGKHVKLTGGTIQRNDTYTQGRMFEVLPESSLTLENIVLDGGGRALSGNTELVFVHGGTFIMNEGAVLQNNKGRTIYITWGPESNRAGGTFLMNGGKITDCRQAVNLNLVSAAKDPSSNLSFVMNDGEICNNTADMAPAIFNQYNGSKPGLYSKVEIKGGRIYNNATDSPDESSTFAGAIYNDSILEISGGEITGNTTPAGRGGGVYSVAGSSGGSLKITGGTIAGNTARNRAPSGNNICVNSGTFILGGAALIPDGVTLYCDGDHYVRKILVESALQHPMEFEQLYGGERKGYICMEGYNGYTLTKSDVQKLSYQDHAFGFALKNGSIELAAFPPYYSYENSAVVTATTTIPAPTYTITIPEQVDMGELTRKKKDAADRIASQEFTLTASNVDNLFDEQKIVVTASAPDGAFHLNDGSHTLPFSLFAPGGTAALANNGLFTEFTGNESKTGRIEVDQSAIRREGTFAGTVTFTISFDNIA